VTAIKFCGITRAEDAEAAVALGVHALGFVFWSKSPRYVSFTDAAAIIRTAPPIVATVGVFVDPTQEDLAFALHMVGVSTLQVHGDSVDWKAIREVTPRIVRAVRLGDGPGGTEPMVEDGATILIDAHDPVRVGGSGQVIDWTRAAAVAARRRVILAGGLTADNVAEAIRIVRPYGVDVASGVELRPGVKDPVKMRAFVAAVRSVDVMESTRSAGR
jgi:phosphoribosylanthranilate isomerase